MIDLTILEERILRAIVALGSDAWGTKILGKIEPKPSLNGVYESLHRLHAKWLIEGSEIPPTSSRGGRAKIVYTVTALGLELLSRRDASRDTLADAMAKFTPDLLAMLTDEEIAELQSIIAGRATTHEKAGSC